MSSDLIDPASLADQRRSRGLKPGELAVLSGVAKRTIQYIEAGQVSPQRDTLWRLTKALHDWDTANESEAAA